MEKSKTFNKVEWGGQHRNSHLSPRNASPSILSEEGISIRNSALSQNIRRKTAPRATNNNNQTGTNDDSESTTMTMSVHEHTVGKGKGKEKPAKKKVNFGGAAPDQMEYGSK